MNTTTKPPPPWEPIRLDKACPPFELEAENSAALLDGAIKQQGQDSCEKEDDTTLEPSGATTTTTTI